MTQPAALPFERRPWWLPLWLVVMLLPLAARFVPWPAFATVLKYSQMAIVLVGIAVYARHGIRKRRGVWTAQSWRRFFTSVIVSLSGMAMMLAFAAGVDAHSSWVGVSHSGTRYILGLALTVAGFTGVFMFAGAMHRFANDGPDSQYDSRLARLWLKVSRSSRP